MTPEDVLKLVDEAVTKRPGVLVVRPCAAIIPTGKNLPFVANGKYAIRVMWAGGNSEYPTVHAC